VEGALSPAARRGKVLFEKAGCAACHPAPLYTDQRKHDLGLGVDVDQGKSFVTPSLREVWRTAPYLYDGRAVTILEVLTRFNSNQRHGTTAALGERDLEDLVEFVLSL
jgi:cytochrome c peroxidase